MGRFALVLWTLQQQNVNHNHLSQDKTHLDMNRVGFSEYINKSSEYSKCTTTNISLKILAFELR